jgi:hypothetical protein
LEAIVQPSALDARTYLQPAVTRTPAFIAGLDLGQAADFSAWTILEHAGPSERSYLPEQHFHARHLDRWPLQTSYTTIVADVVTMLSELAKKGDVTLGLDATGCGRPVLDFVRRALGKPSPIRLVPIQITGGNQVTRDGDIFNVPKRDLASAVQVALQTGRLKISADLPHTSVLVAELQNFRVKLSLAGHDSYGAGAGEEWRTGQHDDLVLSVACALWAAQRSRGATLVTLD